MRLGHKPWAKTQLDVIKTFLLGIHNVFISNTPASIIIYQNTHHPLDLLNECHHPRLGLAHLHKWPQSLDIPRWHRQVMLATEIKDCLQSDRSIQVAVQVNERQGRIDHFIPEKGDTGLISVL